MSSELPSGIQEQEKKEYSHRGQHGEHGPEVFGSFILDTSVHSVEGSVFKPVLYQGLEFGIRRLPPYLLFGHDTERGYQT